MYHDVLWIIEDVRMSNPVGITLPVVVVYGTQRRLVRRGERFTVAPAACFLPAHVIRVAQV